MVDPHNEPRELRDPADIEAITDLDTARMTLRWAMERLRGLERQAREAAEKADWELQMRMKVEEDFRKQLELEGSHFATAERERKARIDELSGLVEKARAEGAEGVRRVREEYEKRFLELEAVEKDRLRELAQKEADFDHFCSQQKSRAELERRQLRAEALREAEERYKTVQRLTDERASQLSAAWARERDGLLKDLAAWRERAETGEARRHELEQRSQADDDVSRRSSRLSSEREDEYQRLSKTWEAQRVLLEGELRRLEEQASRAEAKAAESEKSRRRLEEQARESARLAEDRQAESLRMVESWNRQRATLEEQIRQWQARATEAVQIDRSRELDAERRREQLAARAQAEVQSLQGRLRTRDAEVEALLKTLEDYRTRLGG